MPLKISSSVVQQGDGCDARCMVATFDEVWSGDRDGGITVRAADTGEVLGRKRYEGAQAWALCEVGASVWVGFSNGVVVVFRSSSHNAVHEIAAPAAVNLTGGVQCVYHHAGTVVVGYGNAAVVQYHAQKYHQVRVFRGHSAAVRCLLTRQGLLYAGANDGVIAVWELATGQRRHDMRHERGAVYALANTYSHIWSAGGAGGQGVLRVWDTRTHAVAKTIEHHSAPIVSLVAADRLWAGSWDGSLSLWCPRQLSLLQHIPGSREGRAPAQLNPFGHSPLAMRSPSYASPPRAGDTSPARSPRGSALTPIPPGKVEVMSVLHVNSAKTTRVWVATSDKVLRKLCARAPENGEDVYEEPIGHPPLVTVTQASPASSRRGSASVQEVATPQRVPSIVDVPPQGTSPTVQQLRFPSASGTPSGRSSPTVSPRRTASTGRRESKVRNLEDSVQRFQFENERLAREQQVYRQAAHDAMSLIGGSLQGVPLSRVGEEVASCGRRWRADNHKLLADRSEVQRMHSTHQGALSVEKRERDEWEERAQRYHRESGLLAAKVAVLEAKLAKADGASPQKEHTSSSPQNQTRHTQPTFIANGVGAAGEAPGGLAGPDTPAEAGLRDQLHAELKQKEHWRTAAERFEKEAMRLADEVAALQAVRAGDQSAPNAASAEVQTRKARVSNDEVAQRIRAEFEDRLLAETRAKYRMQNIAEQHDREKQRLQREVADLRAQVGVAPVANSRMAFNRQYSQGPADMRVRADLESRLAAEMRAKQRLQEVCDRQDKEAKHMSKELAELRSQLQVGSIPAAGSVKGTPKGRALAAKRSGSSSTQSAPPIPLNLGKAPLQPERNSLLAAISASADADAEEESMVAVEARQRLHWQDVARKQEVEIAALRAQVSRDDAEAARALAAAHDSPSKVRTPGTSPAFHVDEPAAHPWAELATLREQEVLQLAERLAQATVALDAARGAAATPEEIVPSPTDARGESQRYWEEVAGAREREVQLLAERLSRAKEEIDGLRAANALPAEALSTPPRAASAEGGSPRAATTPPQQTPADGHAEARQWQEVAEARERELKVLQVKVESLQASMRTQEGEQPAEAEEEYDASNSPMNEVVVAKGKVVRSGEQRITLEAAAELEEAREQVRHWQDVAAQYEREIQGLRRRPSDGQAASARNSKAAKPGSPATLPAMQSAHSSVTNSPRGSPREKEPPLDDPSMFVSGFKAFASGTFGSSTLGADADAARAAVENAKLQRELATALAQLEQAETECMNYAELYHEAVSGDVVKPEASETAAAEVPTRHAAEEGDAAPRAEPTVEVRSSPAGGGDGEEDSDGACVLTWFTARPECQDCEFLFLVGQQLRMASPTAALAGVQELQKENRALRTALDSAAADKEALFCALTDARTSITTLRAAVGGSGPTAAAETADAAVPLGWLASQPDCHPCEMLNLAVQSTRTADPAICAEHQVMLRDIADLETRLVDALTENAYLQQDLSHLRTGSPEPGVHASPSIVSDSRDTGLLDTLCIADPRTHVPEQHDTRDVPDAPLEWLASLPDCHQCEYLFLAAQASRIEDPALCSEYHDMMSTIATLEARLADAQVENHLLIDDMQRRERGRNDATPLAWLASRPEATSCEFLFLAAQSAHTEADPVAIEHAELRRAVANLEDRLEVAQSEKSMLAARLRADDPAAAQGSDGGSPLAWLATLPASHPCEMLFVAAQAGRLEEQVCREMSTAMRSVAELEGRCADLTEERDALALELRSAHARAPFASDTANEAENMLSWFSSLPECHSCEFLFLAALSERGGDDGLLAEHHSLQQTVADLEARVADISAERDALAVQTHRSPAAGTPLAWMTSLPECHQCEFLFLAALAERVPDEREYHEMMKLVGRLEARVEDLVDERAVLAQELARARAGSNGGGGVNTHSAPLNFLSSLPECHSCEFLFLATLSDRSPDSTDLHHMQQTVAQLEAEAADLREERSGLVEELTKVRKTLESAARAGLVDAAGASPARVAAVVSSNGAPPPPAAKRSATPPRKVVKVVKVVKKAGGAGDAAVRSVSAPPASAEAEATGTPAAGRAALQEEVTLLKAQLEQAETACIMYAEQCYGGQAAGAVDMPAPVARVPSILRKDRRHSPTRVVAVAGSKTRGSVSFAAGPVVRRRAVPHTQATVYVVRSTRVQVLQRYYALWVRLHAEREHFYLMQSVREKLEDIQRSASPVDPEVDLDAILQRVLTLAADMPPSRESSEESLVRD